MEGKRFVVFFCPIQLHWQQTQPASSPTNIGDTRLYNWVKAVDASTPPGDNNNNNNNNRVGGDEFLLVHGSRKCFFLGVRDFRESHPVWPGYKLFQFRATKNPLKQSQFGPALNEHRLGKKLLHPISGPSF